MSSDSGEMILPFKRFADTYMEILDEKDKSLREEVRRIMSIVEKWEYLWCLARGTIGGRKMVGMKEFFHPFCDSCRDVLVASMLAFHGCHKQSLQVLRNCLDLAVLCDYLSQNRWKYEEWREGRRLRTFSSLAEEVFDPVLARVLIQLHDKLSSAAHSGKIKETDRIFASAGKIGSCSKYENEKCPMIKTMTLSVKKNNLQEYLSYLEKVYLFVVFRVLDRFPKILTRYPESLCYLVDRRYLEVKEDGTYFHLRKAFEE